MWQQVVVKIKVNSNKDRVVRWCWVGVLLIWTTEGQELTSEGVIRFCCCNCNNIVKKSPREVTWQGRAIVMDKCIMKQVIGVFFVNNRKHVCLNSLTYAFFVVNKNSILPTSYVKSRGEVDM